MAALNRPASPRRRAVLKTLALASATGPLAWAAWRADPLDWTADYRSAAGELREVALSDGSRLYLNTASAVDVAFSAASRLLRLRAGEIALHVRDESGAQARPFVVRTRYGDIEARAGRYCVRQEDGFCRVSVQEGALRGGARGTVSAAGGGRRAAPGRSGPIRRRARRSPCRRLDAQRAARP